MCGIVGYIGNQNATPIILEGLKRLEYRGYDSAGIAIVNSHQIEIRRNSGKLQNLEKLVSEKPITGSPGIGHTRWATHGIPSEKNAHPHLGYNGRVALVHNGIVENYLELRNELEEEGVGFNSDTDTETIVHLIEKYLDCGLDLKEAFTSTLCRIHGAHGIVMISLNEPDKILAARIGNAGGVVIGLGNEENFIASDIPAILPYTNKVVFLETHQIAVINKNSIEISNISGERISYKQEVISWDPISAVKGNYRHFMQKEIHEQVRSLTDTLAGRIDFNSYKVLLPQLNLSSEKARNISAIKIIACGTAAYAGMVGKHIIETITAIPVEVEIASEFRYRRPIIRPNTVVIAISQSGETADTLAAIEEAKNRGANVWSIVNAIGSQAMRISDGFISMQVGPEIGVASTKAFTAPIVDIYLLAIYLADLMGTLDSEKRKELIREVSQIPDLVGKCLEREKDIIPVSQKFKDIQHMLYLGRGINMPIAYEGALKLKEISYIHAEAYPGGEMKHGPIALIDKELPVLVILPKDPWHEKMISQVEQVKSRGGKAILVATDGDKTAEELGDEIFWIPPSSWLLNPILAVIPLQIFAYHIAAMKGLDVDQPRNLAKSVTVE